MKYRYHCVVEGDWGGIVAAWERDREKLEERPRRDREETEEEVEARTTVEVRKLIYAGQVRQSMGRGTSHGLADSHSPRRRGRMRGEEAEISILAGYRALRTKCGKDD